MSSPVFTAFQSALSQEGVRGVCGWEGKEATGALAGKENWGRQEEMSSIGPNSFL